MRPDLEAKTCWNTPGYDYYAYLPKKRTFNGHLLEPLKSHTPTLIQRDGRWFVDDKTRDLWWSLDIKFTHSINAVGGKLLNPLGHYEPSCAFKYGFTRGHKTMKGLKICLEISKHAFIHRLAYLLFVISRRYNWDQGTWYFQEWRDELTAACGAPWVDSVWSALCRQWETRNFIGVVVSPNNSSMRWLEKAYKFGVPIWVWFPRPDCYQISKLDGGFVLKQWIPTHEQVAESRSAQLAKRKEQHTQPAANTPLSDPPANPPPANSELILPPSVIPQGAQWYPSWERFFLARSKAHEDCLKGASDVEIQSWNGRAENAKKFNVPKKGGPKVYIWEACDSGGFFRVCQDYHEFSRDWLDYYKEALVFNPSDNTWDHCPFRWKPAVETGNPDDPDGGRVEDDWFLEPTPPPPLPDGNATPLDFLYHRYGYLTVEPTNPPTIAPRIDRSTAHRIVGLEVRNTPDPLDHLTAFVSSVLQGQLPTGHCDLSPTSPPTEMFSPIWKTPVSSTVFRSRLPQLSEDMAFTLICNPNRPQPLVVHESLSVLQMM